MVLMNRAIHDTFRPAVLLILVLSTCNVNAGEYLVGTDINNDDLGIEPRIPINFSWVIEGQLAAMGFPGDDSNMAFLVQSGVTRLITLLENWEPETHKFPEMDTLAVKVKDFTPPTLEQIEQCMNYIEESIALNKAVGIHCAHGRGRTGTVISCYFVKLYNLDPDDAIEKLRTIRPGSVETSEQEEMVRTYSKHLLTSGKIGGDQRTNIQTGDALISGRIQGDMPCPDL